MDIGNIISEHEVGFDRFGTALLGEDDVGALIRCHYEADRAINHVLTRLSNGRSNAVEGWQNFAQKLEVCRVLGVHDNFLAPLKTLNKHRNSLAHKGQEYIEDQEALDLFRQVSVLYPPYSGDFRMTITGKHQFDKTYDECTTKEKYVISILLAVSTLAALPQIASTSISS